MGIRLVSSSQASPRLDFVSMLSVVSFRLCKFSASKRSNKVTSVNGLPLWKRGLTGEKIESHYFFVQSPDFPFPGVGKSAAV